MKSPQAYDEDAPPPKEDTMCHGYEWELLMARARDAERRKQEKSKPEAAKQPAATPAAPARDVEPVPV